MLNLKKPAFWIVFVLALGCIVLGLCLVLRPAGPPLSEILPEEINFNNRGSFWATDGCFYYLQDGWYNMGAYRSEGGTAKKIFESSDFADPEYGGGNLGRLRPYDGLLYFTVRYQDVELMLLYCYDPETDSYAPVLSIEDECQDWLICEDHLVLLGWSERSSEKHSDGFWHEPVIAYDLRTGERTIISENAEDFGLVDGELRYVSYDGEYELFRHDFKSGQSGSMGRFPLIFEPGEFFSGYSSFSFSEDGIAMYNANREHYHSLVVYSASAGTLKTWEMPRGIHCLVVAGDSAFAQLYDLVEGNSSAVGSPDNGLYRVSLSDGSLTFLGWGTSGTLHVASEDCVFLIYSHAHLLLSGPWRTVYQISPETGETVRNFRI